MHTRHRTTIRLATFSLAFAIAFRAAPQDTADSLYHDGMVLLEAGHTGDAAPKFAEAAKQGNADAQNELGKMYLTGNGLEKDVNAAREWLQKSADAGNIRGMTNLGLMYMGDRGIPADYDKAYLWLAKAALEGQPIAQYFLAKLYEDGKGTNKNRSAAFQLLLKSAQQGYAQAQVDVGDYYLDGDEEAGVEADIDAARSAFKTAAQSSDPEILAEIADRLLEATSDLYDPAAAVPLLKTSAEGGNAWGEFLLAEQYRLGVPDMIEKDMVKAVELYKASAQQQYGDALLALAKCYLKGDGIERDANGAYLCAVMAMKHGVVGAQEIRDEAAKGLTPEQLESAKRIEEVLRTAPK